MFADYQPPHPEAKKTFPAMRAISQSMIPFDLPLHLKTCLRKDYSQRFNLCNGIANLIPPLPSSSHCPLCDCEDSWSETVYLAEEVFLVTPMCCYPAKGTYCYIVYDCQLLGFIIVFMRKCITDGCVSKLSYDGLDDGVLNMKIFCISHEVLRNHMFHFLYGR